MSDAAREDQPGHTLPSNTLHHTALRHIALLLPDPSALAATCRATAALLDQDSLLLDWAQAWLPRRSGSSAQHRHPGYALLRWQRLRCMDMERLEVLLRKWLARHTPPNLTDAAAADRRLDTALQALLPHPHALLLPYAAQGGHMQLLQNLLADDTKQQRARLFYTNGDGTSGGSRGSKAVAGDVVLSAARAAAHAGQDKALHVLLSHMQSCNQYSDTALGKVHLELLEIAVKAGSRSAACVAAVLERCQQHKCWLAQLRKQQQHEGHSSVLCTAAQLGDANVVAQLLSVGLQRTRAAYEAAVPNGHLHLLPLLRPDHMDGMEIARHIVAGVEIARAAARAQLLPLLPHAMALLLGSQQGRTSDVDDCCADAVLSLLSHNEVAALEAIWQAVDGGSMLSLLNHVVEILAEALEQPRAETVRWLLQHAAPEARIRQDAALAALEYGQQEVLSVLQEPEVTAALIEGGGEWLAAQLKGQLLQAVRTGDGSRVRVALQQLGGMLAGDSDYQHDVISGLSELDAGAVWAVMEVLLPVLGSEERWDFVSADTYMPISWRLKDAQLHALGEQYPSLLPRMLEQTVQLSWIVMRPAAADLLAGLVWRVCHPHQQPSYLSKLCQQNLLDRYYHSAIIQLLHLLAAKAGSSGGVTQAADSTAGDPCPVGGRLLARQLLCDVLELGAPDLLHALLVYMERCQPFVMG